MSLNETDKSWIREAIQNAHKVRGWGVLARFVKDWSGTSAAVAIILFAVTQWTAYVEFRTKTTDHLDGIESSLRRIDPQFANTQLKQIGEVDTRTIKEVQQIVQSAKNDGHPLDLEIVQETGKKFVEASVKNQSAWGPTLELLDYKSSSNIVPLQIPSIFSSSYVSHYAIHFPAGFQMPTGHSIGTVPHDVAAKIAPIGTDIDNDLKVGDAYIVEDGGGIIIDGMEMRDVVFRGTHIVYNGGPIRMTNVYFLNCTFEMEPKKNTRNLAIAVLAPSPAITFSGE